MPYELGRRTLQGLSMEDYVSIRTKVQIPNQGRLQLQFIDHPFAIR